MREIKFRAFYRGKMLPDVGSLEGRVIDQAFQTYDTPNTEVETLVGAELMQFTGLKDKNGVEVYDGDIVKFTRMFGFQSDLMNEWKNLHNLESINDVHGSHFLGQIVVDIHRGLMFKQLTTDYAEPLFTRHFKMMCNHDWLTGEVIGNVHENPELLN